MIRGLFLIYRHSSMIMSTPWELSVVCPLDAGVCFPAQLCHMYNHCGKELHGRNQALDVFPPLLFPRRIHLLTSWHVTHFPSSFRASTTFINNGKICK